MWRLEKNIDCQYMHFDCSLVIMVVNKIVIPLLDWIIRMDGIIMLVALFVVSFSTVKCIR